MADIDMAISMVDKVTPGLKTVMKGLDELEKKFPVLANRIKDAQDQNAKLGEGYAKLKTAIEAQSKAVKEAENAYEEAANETNRTNLDQANLEYKLLTDRLKEYRTASQDCQREVRNLRNEMQKLDAAGATGDGWGGGAAKAIADKSDALTGWGMAASALGKQVSGALSGIVSYNLSSAMGDTEASAISSVVSGALEGGAAGAVAGPWGAAIGAAVGGLSGWIVGQTEKAQKEDDIFRSYRDNLISSVTENTSAALSSGTATAAQREQDSIAFSALLGDSAVSTILLNSIKELANVTPYVYDDLTGIARQLAIFDATSGDLYGNLVKIGDAGSALGMSASEMQGLAQLLGKIGESEQYEATFTRSLRNYGINPTDMLAEYYGITKAEALELMNASKKENRISGIDAMEAILSVLDSRYGGMMARQAETYAGALSTREGLEAETQNFMGEGYTALRTPGLQAHNDWLGEFVTGDTLSAIGRAMANRDNLQDAIYRDVMGGVFNGDKTAVVNDEETQGKIDELRREWLTAQAEYGDAQKAHDEQWSMEAGAKMASIYEEAEALALSAADANEKLDAWDEAAVSLVKNTGAIIEALGAHQDAITQSIAEQGGLVAAAIANIHVQDGSGSVFADTAANNRRAAGLFSSGSEVSTVMENSVRGGRHRAMGQHVIPYDDFPILAHEGEMLLTAGEARQYRDAGGGARVTITGNTFNVRQESDIDAIAEALARKVNLTAMIMA